MSPIRRKKLSALPHQIEARTKTLAALKQHKRAQLIMACGTGKTFAALLVAEGGRFKSIVVFVPSLALVRQILGEWTASTSWGKWDAIAVCSDPSVADDSIYISPDEVGCEVTTNREHIETFINKAGVRVVFCTYQSAHLLKDLDFDFGIFDEAHKTAGKNNKAFAFALDDENVKIERRLFMTATPRHVRVVNDEGDEEPVFSMKDEKVYGPVAYRLSFREAINHGLICDYKIAICALLEDVRDVERCKSATQVALRKAMVNFGTKKVITFHSTVKRAKDFSASQDEALRFCTPSLHDVPMWHINGKMPTRERDKKLSEMSATGGVVTNVRCLSEGVDFPDVDMVAFIDPKRSSIDIVQVVGRCLRVDREHREKKQGIIFVPVYIKPGEDDEVAVAQSKFDHVYDVLQALKEEDELLAEELRTLGTKEGGTKESRVVVVGEIDMPTLTRAISVRLARAVGRDPDWKKRALLALPIGTIRPKAGTRLGVPLNNYTCKTSQSFDPIFDYAIRNKQPQWWFDAAAADKKELLERAKRGDIRPNKHKDRLGQSLVRFTNNYSSSYDQKFDSEIRTVAPDWFINPACYKKQLLEIAQQEGNTKPHYKSVLGTRFTRYAVDRTGASYDQSFAAEIKKLAPHWFRGTKQNSASENKQMLLELAQHKKPKPVCGTRLRYALNNYTTSTSRAYDQRFCTEIHNLAPEWFETAAEKVHQYKKQLLTSARNNKQRPERRSLLARRLETYTSKNSEVYDATFDKLIRKLAPLWFLRTKTQHYKQQLLALAKNGSPRPSTGTLLHRRLTNFTCPSQNGYDKEFSISIYRIAPHWNPKHKHGRDPSNVRYFKIARKKPSKKRRRK